MKRRSVGIWLILPALIFIFILFMFPIAKLVINSLIVVQADGWHIDLSGYLHFLSRPYSWGLIERTLWISLCTVFFCFMLAFPVALLMRQLPGRWNSLLAILLLSPLLTSVVVRTLAWTMLLGPKGLINSFLATFNLGALTLMYNDFGVIIGLTHVFFGYMLLSLTAAVFKIDNQQLLSAANLGANRWQVVWYIILPQCKSGILAGSILVFTMSASSYIVPVLLGGTSTKVMATEVYDLAIQYLEWRDASIVAVILFIVVWFLITLVGYVDNPKRIKQKGAVR